MSDDPLNLARESLASRREAMQTNTARRTKDTLRQIPDVRYQGYNAAQGQPVVTAGGEPHLRGRLNTNGHLQSGAQLQEFGGRGVPRFNQMSHKKRVPLESENKRVKSGKIKILFSIEKDGMMEFYIGGDRPKPTPLFAFEKQKVWEARLANLGRGKNRFIASVLTKEEIKNISAYSITSKFRLNFRKGNRQKQYNFTYNPQFTGNSVIPNYPNITFLGNGQNWIFEILISILDESNNPNSYLSTRRSVTKHQYFVNWKNYQFKVSTDDFTRQFDPYKETRDIDSPVWVSDNETINRIRIFDGLNTTTDILGVYGDVLFSVDGKKSIYIADTESAQNSTYKPKGYYSNLIIIDDFNALNKLLPDGFDVNNKPRKFVSLLEREKPLLTNCPISFPSSKTKINEWELDLANKRWGEGKEIEVSVYEIPPAKIWDVKYSP